MFFHGTSLYIMKYSEYTEPWILNWTVLSWQTSTKLVSSAENEADDGEMWTPARMWLGISNGPNLRG